MIRSFGWATGDEFRRRTDPYPCDRGRRAFRGCVEPDRLGQYDFAWLSGPNKGYGFSTTRLDGGAMSEREIEASIRNFLVQVDPGTGYIE
jgi:hypothetical protein